MDKISYYNIVTIQIDIFQFHISIISNLVFLFIAYSFLPNVPLKNESKLFLGFYFFKWIFNSIS
jgi:hypothetical protein